eukprot:6199130-Pleurochrysis_carterae.AAC.6
MGHIPYVLGNECFAALIALCLPPCCHPSLVVVRLSAEPLQARFRLHRFRGTFQKKIGLNRVSLSRNRFKSVSAFDSAEPLCTD